MIELARKVKRALFGKSTPALTPLSRALLEDFSERLLLKKCTAVTITPMRITRWDGIKHALLFQGKSRKNDASCATLYELCFTSSSEQEYVRRNRLELFLMAERRGEELKTLLPDLTIEIIDLNGNPLNAKNRAKILAQAEGLNISL